MGLKEDLARSLGRAAARAIVEAATTTPAQRPRQRTVSRTYSQPKPTRTRSKYCAEICELERQIDRAERQGDDPFPLFVECVKLAEPSYIQRWAITTAIAGRERIEREQEQQGGTLDRHGDTVWSLFADAVRVARCREYWNVLHALNYSASHDSPEELLRLALEYHDWMRGPTERSRKARALLLGVAPPLDQPEEDTLDIRAGKRRWTFVALAAGCIAAVLALMFAIWSHP